MIKSICVRLSDLFAGLGDCRFLGSSEILVRALSYRSDEVVDGCLFFCVPGFVRDGHDFASGAVDRGAIALCVERPLDLPVPQVIVSSVREAMGPVAAAFYGHPSSRLRTVGITGTNGKTTSAFLVAHLLDEAGLRAGLLGTIERRVGGVAASTARTTPEAIDIQRDMASMVRAGDHAMVMEVSSHALDLGRVLGTQFHVVAFTNLTQDHLDYHKTLESYFVAKQRLFIDPRLTSSGAPAVINIDDSYGRRLAQEYPSERLLTCSSTSGGGVQADLVMRDYVIDATGSRGTLVVRGNALRYAADGGASRGRSEKHFRVTTRLVGAFNVANTLTALGIGLGLGLEIEQMLVALERFPGVPGRMESVHVGQPFAVLVDYAHTPDSVRNVLETARAITTGRLLAVLGCGGDRDGGKRPHMGREAEALADKVFVTSDNPRTEDPEAIIRDILGGMVAPAVAVVEVDRRKAIAAALMEARPDDVVLLLGKGHESGQEFAGHVIPFDDRLVAREVLEGLHGVGR